MLLNLLAALSLASVGAVAGISSNSQSVDGAELDKSSLIQRKNANTIFLPNGNPVNYLNHADLSENVLFDGVLHFYNATGLGGNYFILPSGASYVALTYTNIRAYFDATGFDVSITDYGNEFSYFLDGHALTYHDDPKFTAILPDYISIRQLNLTVESSDPYLSLVDWDNARLTILKSGYTWADYEASHQIVSGIASGLTSVQHYATSLVSGFDALALDNGALTNSMAFAFTLLGIGTAVGICKLSFNWISGRHGM